MPDSRQPGRRTAARTMAHEMPAEFTISTPRLLGDRLRRARPASLNTEEVKDGAITRLDANSTTHGFPLIGPRCFIMRRCRGHTLPLSTPHEIIDAGAARPRPFTGRAARRSGLSCWPGRSRSFC